MQECRKAWHKRVLLHVKHGAISSGKKQVETRSGCVLVRHFLSLLDVGRRGDLCGEVSGMWEGADRARRVGDLGVKLLGKKGFAPTGRQQADDRADLSTASNFVGCSLA